MALHTKVTDQDKGILTVTLTGCSNLEVRRRVRDLRF